jgi:hypothetical protein
VNKKMLSEVMRYLGGLTSDAKARAARKNGKKGGRPVNPVIQRIMKQHKCSRQYAYEILKRR